jgi:hypothetical protein
MRESSDQGSACATGISQSAGREEKNIHERKEKEKKGKNVPKPR